MAYQILINETQRLRLIAALNLLEQTDPAKGYADPDIEYLAACLDSVPADELDSPGVLHGLCL
jgi:hypothetical protein